MSVLPAVLPKLESIYFQKLLGVNSAHNSPGDYPALRIGHARTACQPICNIKQCRTTPDLSFWTPTTFSRVDTLELAVRGACHAIDPKWYRAQLTCAYEGKLQ